ncbi:MAG: hypothetical protein K5989_03100 [Lachnospiraceae bacterium]|nr:hypothetical protein [Lachnospiraceae bacterium]
MSKKGSSKNEGNTIGLGAEISRQGYEASVVQRMTGRAGASTQTGAPGIALEITGNDLNNFKNITKPGTVTRLTKSPIATQVDAVTISREGKVLERIQYKDTPSKAGNWKSLSQTKSGKYNQVQLRGTKESAKMFNSAAEAEGLTKRMKSTGISHDTTQRIGDKFTKQMPKVKSVGKAVKGATIIAVGVTTAIEVGKSIKNKDSVGECTSHVLSKGAESAVSASVAAVAGEVATGAVAGLLTTVSAPAAIPAIAGIGVAILAGGAVSKVAGGKFDGIGDRVGKRVDNTIKEISDNRHKKACSIYDSRMKKCSSF